MLLSFFVLFVTLIVAGGMFYVEKLEREKVLELRTTLEELEQDIDFDKIAAYQDLSARLGAARAILEKHVVFTTVLRLLEMTVSQTVGLVELSYDSSQAGELKMQITGAAPNYGSVFLQYEDWRKQRALKNIISEDLQLDPITGVVGFRATVLVDPGAVLFTARREFMGGAESEDGATRAPSPSERSITNSP